MLAWVKRFHQLSWHDRPVLVIQGLKDETVDFKHGMKLVKNKFPKAHIININEARHHLVCEDEARFERVVNAADIYFERRKKTR